MKQKTWKREVALLLLAALGFTVFTHNLEMASVLVWPVMTFAAAAFGLDSVAKQFGDR